MGLRVLLDGFTTMFAYLYILCAVVTHASIWRVLLARLREPLAAWYFISNFVTQTARHASGCRDGRDNAL